MALFVLTNFPKYEKQIDRRKLQCCFLNYLWWVLKHYPVAIAASQ